MISLLLHTPWELAQTNALSTGANKSWRTRLENCSLGIVSDVMYTIGLYYLLGWWYFDYLWPSKAGMVQYGLVLLISFVGAYLTELVAQRLGWWHFNQMVPHLRNSKRPWPKPTIRQSNEYRTTEQGIMNFEIQYSLFDILRFRIGVNTYIFDK